MIVLIHSSKTMRARSSTTRTTSTPALIDQAEKLIAYLRTVPPRQLAKVMTISADLADRTHEEYLAWRPTGNDLAPAAETFTGDIYSGLRVDSFSAADRRYADKHLRILSGLYGILRPFDAISPYRLEMGYRLPAGPYANLYRFWGSAIASQVPRTGRIVNLAANEYSRTVLPYVAADRVVTPKFLTVDPKSGQPKFVVVHAKIARGTFARWLITERIRDTPRALQSFGEIGYAYDPSLSTPGEPCYVCQEFEGKGLSVRLT
jgi:cytoplasmic iron level regulating protein YaaA (DUF328/UPF0246 family)